MRSISSLVYTCVFSPLLVVVVRFFASSAAAVVAVAAVVAAARGPRDDGREVEGSREPDSLAAAVDAVGVDEADEEEDDEPVGREAD